MTALGVCQQGKCLIHPNNLKLSQDFSVEQVKLLLRDLFHEKSGPESVFDPGVRPR